MVYNHTTKAKTERFWGRNKIMNWTQNITTDLKKMLENREIAWNNIPWNIEAMMTKF